MPEKNALAELAKRLDQVGVELCNDFLDADSKDAIHKAQLIVAELANVKPGRIFGGRFDVNSLLNLETAYEACRMIAEEGLRE